MRGWPLLTMMLATACGARTSILPFGETADAGTSKGGRIDSGVTSDSGAARDSGSDVFITRDAGHESGTPCGACGQTCPSPQTCQSGFCADPTGVVAMCDGVACTGECTANGCLVTLIADPQGPTLYGILNSVATDGTHVYWNDVVRGTVNNFALADQAETMLATSPGANGLTADATNVYWAQFSEESDVNIDLLKVPLCGGSVTTLVSSTSGFVEPSSHGNIVVDATYVYWVDGDENAVLRVPIAGGTPTTVVSGIEANAFTVDATSLYYLSSGVIKVPLGGGATTTLASVPGGSASIVVDSVNAYWTQPTLGVEGETPGAVMMVPIAGGAVTTLASNLPYITQLAVDATNVYWVADYANVGSVKSVPIAGGAVTTLAANLNQPTGIAVTATSVIWSDLSGLHSLTPKP